MTRIEEKQLAKLLSDAAVVAGNMPRLVELRLSETQSVTVVGDTHGDIGTVMKIERQFLQHSSVNDGDWLLFLGDYVDRNVLDIENINNVLELLVNFPGKIVLLRGNHEEYFTNIEYGFHNNLEMQGLGDFYSFYEEIFKRLPLACYMQDIRVFCCHGMPPVQAVTLEDINKLENRARIEDFDPVTMQLLWNDPLEDNGDVSLPSPRGVGFRVGKQDLDGFMHVNDIKLVVRSHQAFPEGYRFFSGRKVLSIFSRPNYGMHANDATIARLHGDGRVDVLKASIEDEEFSIIDTLKLEIP